MSGRIFDNLDGSSSAEDRHFSRVAHRMRRSAWWRTVPVYDEPKPVAGEIETGPVFDAELRAALVRAPRGV